MLPVYRQKDAIPSVLDHFYNLDGISTHFCLDTCFSPTVVSLTCAGLQNIIFCRFGVCVCVCMYMCVCVCVCVCLCVWFSYSKD